MLIFVYVDLSTREKLQNLRNEKVKLMNDFINLNKSNFKNDDLSNYWKVKKMMEIKLLSGALGAEINGIDLTDVSDENFKKINDLLLEHKVIFFRDQPITKEQQIALAEKFGPLETHAYVKGLDNYPRNCKNY